MPFTHLYSLKDFLRSVVLGILVGWLLVSMSGPTHRRFEFDTAHFQPTSMEGFWIA